ncbi:MAG: tetratricopeptide repeat protein [Desulfatibacillum sp.]|nr:tetratricopeptide repeat protein [Desulfatibacillum sp.]
MKIVFVPMLLFGLVLLPPPGLCDCQQARTMATQARALFKEHPRGSLKLLHEANQLCPDDYAIQYNLGLALYLTGRPGDAYETWSGLARNHTNSRLLVNLGWLALELGNPAEAEQWRQKSEEHNPSDPNAVALQVEILFAMNKPKQALDIAALNKGRVPFNISREHLEKVTDGIWQACQDGDKSEAAVQLKDAIREYPEIKKLQSARDLMRILFFDRKVEMSGAEE